MDKNIIWNHVKTLRFDYIKKISNLVCENNILDQSVINNFEKFGEIIGLENSPPMDRNLTKSDISEAAEMFLALSSCPSFHEKLYWKAIFGNGTISKIVMLTSNVMRKAKDDFKMKATEIFARISSVIGLKHISFHHEGNHSHSIQLKTNISDIKGEQRT